MKLMIFFQLILTIFFSLLQDIKKISLLNLFFNNKIYVVGGNTPSLTKDIDALNDGATVYVPSMTQIFFTCIGESST